MGFRQVISQLYKSGLYHLCIAPQGRISCAAVAYQWKYSRVGGRAGRLRD